MSEPDQMKILFVNHTAELGGGEIALLRLLQAKPQVEATVILGADGPLKHQLATAGVPVVVLPLGVMGRVSRNGSVTPFRLVKFAIKGSIYAFRLALLIGKLRPDLVQANSLKAGFLAGFACRLTRVPLVWHLRDRVAPDYMRRTAMWLCRVALAILPQHIVTNSIATQRTLVGVRSRSTVLYDIYRPRYAPDLSEHEPLRVVMIGRLAPWKGQHVFIESLKRLQSDTRAIQAQVVGSALFGETQYAERVGELAAGVGGNVNLQLEGFVMDVESILHDADVLVHASTIPEPFGQVILEAMAAGVPVIATSGGGSEELLTSGVEGILIPPDDVEALATELRGLLDSPPRRIDMAKAGVQRSFDFDPDVLVPRYEAFWSRMIGRNT